MSVLISLNQNTREEILQLAKNTSVELLEERRSLHDIMQTCKNICKLLEISEENTWIDLELNGYLVKFKTRDELYDNLPAYRKTVWKFYDLYGNTIILPPDIMDLFGKSIVYQSVMDLENNDHLTFGSHFLEKFNKFILEHGMDYVSKNVRIHEAKISKLEIIQVLEGVKKRIQELLDIIISLLEFDLPS